MSVTVFRPPTYAPPWQYSFTPSWMIRPISSVASQTGAGPVQIHYKPMQPTVGHLGFLGVY